jgi:DNA ligase-associated metallophosphoesterase
MLRIEVQNQELILLASRAIYWPGERALLLSDVHLGKSAHFRKAALAVPHGVHEKDLGRLDRMISETQVKRVFILGDLFHSVYNPVWEIFGGFVKSHPSISFELILGNHDILSRRQYEKFQIVLHDEFYKIDPFVLLHDAADIKDENKYHITGHLHPGVRLRGKARQSLRLPCFYFNSNYAVLPAFGSFTGLATVRPKRTDRVFGIIDESVIALPVMAKEHR